MFDPVKVEQEFREAVKAVIQSDRLEQIKSVAIGSGRTGIARGVAFWVARTNGHLTSILKDRRNEIAFEEVKQIMPTPSAEELEAGLGQELA